MYLDLLDTSCANWHNVKLCQHRILERNCQMRRYHFLIPACLPSKLLNTCGFSGTRQHPTLSPAFLPSYLGMCYSVFRETAPTSSFLWCSMGWVADRFQRGKVWASSPAQSQSGDSIICRIAQQLLCQSVDHSQDLCNKLLPLALVDTLLQHSSSFLGVVSALYPLSCLLRRLICFLLATHSLCKSHCG